MSTTPNEPGGGTRDRGGMGGMAPGQWAGARMPIPGNAEFAYLVIAAIFLAIVAWIADTLGARDWWTAFVFLSIAYILSRGVAKASRVLEQ
jgi:hypothetical protein